MNGTYGKKLQTDSYLPSEEERLLGNGVSISKSWPGKMADIPVRNSIRLRRPETKCGRAWAVFDEVSAAKGGPASFHECKNLALARGLNIKNVETEHWCWRVYHGIHRPKRPLKQIW